jgi:flagellar biosynthesis chaperone FliJ
MNKLKLAKRLCATREKLRDLAAAKSAQAEAHTQRALSHEHRAEEELQSVFEEARPVLEQATCAALSLLYEDQTLARDHLQQMSAARKEAETQAEAARSALLQREREVRRAEKLCERLREARDHHQAREEQRAADDRAPRRGEP